MTEEELAALPAASTLLSLWNVPVPPKLPDSVRNVWPHGREGINKASAQAGYSAVHLKGIARAIQRRRQKVVDFLRADRTGHDIRELQTVTGVKKSSTSRDLDILETQGLVFKVTTKDHKNGQGFKYFATKSFGEVK